MPTRRGTKQLGPSVTRASTSHAWPGSDEDFSNLIHQTRANVIRGVADEQVRRARDPVLSHQDAAENARNLRARRNNQRNGGR